MVAGGIARAYPLRLLNWHEVINDTLGGQPVAITYSPLCDSSVGFRRMVADKVQEFGVSGLLLNSNLIMYNRQSGAADESLWSQLQCRAIAGPAAASQQTLEVLPIAVVSWQTR